MLTGIQSIRRAALAWSAIVLTTAVPGPVEAAVPWSLETPQGQHIEFTGQSKAPATVLFFWATWCPYCKALLPHLQSVMDQYGDDVRLYAINIMEDGDPAAFLAEAGYDWVLLIEGDEVAAAYGIGGTPGLLVIDRQGAIVFDLRRVQRAARAGARVKGAITRPQAASRIAPFWAAELRRALDPMTRTGR